MRIWFATAWRWLWIEQTEQRMSGAWLAAMQAKHKPSRTAEPIRIPPGSRWRRVVGQCRALIS